MKRILLCWRKHFVHARWQHWFFFFFFYVRLPLCHVFKLFKFHIYFSRFLLWCFEVRSFIALQFFFVVKNILINCILLNKLKYWMHHFYFVYKGKNKKIGYLELYSHFMDMFTTFSKTVPPLFVYFKSGRAISNLWINWNAVG